MMNKKYLPLLLILLFVGCENNLKKPNVTLHSTNDVIGFSQTKVSDVHIWEFEYDSCEYVMVRWSPAHKGNCKYCQARKCK